MTGVGPIERGWPPPFQHSGYSPVRNRDVTTWKLPKPLLDKSTNELLADSLLIDKMLLSYSDHSAFEKYGTVVLCHRR